MDSLRNHINYLLVNIFNDILRIEENSLKEGIFKDISIKEVHTIEAVGIHNETMGEIAKRLNITLGTLTVAIDNLEKKGYVERLKDKNDKRIVRIGLKKKGKLLFRIHEKFHWNLVEEALTGLNQSEMVVLENIFSNIYYHLKKL